MPNGRVERVSDSGAVLNCKAMTRREVLQFYDAAGATAAAQLQRKAHITYWEADMQTLLWQLGGALVGGGIGLGLDARGGGTAASGSGTLILGGIGWILGSLGGTTKEAEALKYSRAAADAYNASHAKAPPPESPD